MIVNEKYWLLSPSETKGFIKFTQNNCLPKNNSYLPENSGCCNENNTKESKVKESINKYANQQNVDSAQEKALITLMLNDKSEFSIYKKDIEQLQELYPAVDILTQLRNMKGWLIANPTRRKTLRGINKFIHNWLAKEQDKGYRGINTNSNIYTNGLNTASQIEKRKKELGL